MSFRIKTVLGIALVEVLVLIVLIGVNHINLGSTARTQLFQRAQSTAHLFAAMVTDPLIATDLATLDAMVDNVLQSEELVYVRVRNVSGRVIARGGAPAALAAAFTADQGYETALQDRRIDVAAPVSLADQRFGTVEIAVSTDRVEAEIAAALRLDLWLALAGLAAVVVFGFVLGTVLTRQLEVLRSGALAIDQGDLSTRIPIRGRDELAETAACFNDMAASLEARQTELTDNREKVARIVSCMKDISAGDLDGHVPYQHVIDEIGDMARATGLFQSVMQDIRDARAEQARLIHAVDQLDEHVAIFDRKGTVLFANQAFRAFNSAVLRALPEAFTYPEFLHAGLAAGRFPDAAGHEERWLAESLGRLDQDSPPAEVRLGADTVFVVRRTAVPGIGFVVSSTDVTELRISQAQLIQASKLATLGEMATGIAHELNQPLGVIRMASDNCLKRLERGLSDHAYLTKKLKRIGEQTERAAQIIDHMRIHGRMDDGTRAPFDLAASLGEACALMRQQLGVLDIRLDLQRDDGPRWSMGQAVMFEQVILNLITNARDAILSRRAQRSATDGGDRIRLCLTGAETGGNHMVVVEDTGGGVPEHLLERLFDPFFTTKEPGKGTGLGLSISYGIIRRCGGAISARNSDVGAAFQITLPAIDPGASATEAA